MDPNVQRLLDIIASSQAQTALNSTDEAIVAPVASTPSTASVASNAPDPSLITTWPAALQYFIKHVGINDYVVQKVRKLIENQREHEEIWWKGRQEIMDAYANRIQSILRHVGVKLSEAEDPLRQEQASELARYDREVYEKSQQMSDDIYKDLANLGIPFFCGRHVANDDTKENRKKVIELLEGLCHMD